MTLTGKRLMILGGGASQMPIVERALQLGCHVITVDNIPDNTAHRRAHESVDVSTTDVQAVVQAAEQLKIDGVLTFASDVATVSVAAVCAACGLPGPPLDAARILSTKTLFRSVVRQCHGNFPCVAAESQQQLLAALDQLAPPIIVKPADSSGSRGVTRIERRDPDQLAAAFDAAHPFSRSGTVCIEPWIDGVHASGDGFLIDGQFAVVAVTDKYREQYVPTGHSIPSSLPDEVIARVASRVAHCCGMAGYRTGPVDFDVIIPSDSESPEPVVIEVSPRLGGNGIPQLVDRAGFGDLISANIHWALGRSPTWPQPGTVRPCGSLMFGSPHAGRLTRITPGCELRQRLPRVFAAECYYEPGQHVPAFEHGGTAMGMVLFDLEEDYSTTSARIREALAIEVIPESPSS